MRFLDCQKTCPSWDKNRLVIFAISVFAMMAAAFTTATAQNGSGTLKVTSFPSGAKVVIDSVDSGKVTPMSVSLPVGDHTVVVSIQSTGWNPDSRTVTIASGNNDLSVTLLPTAATPAHAAGPCFDNTNRYVDCGNGTVTDTVTGLIWLKQANCLPTANWKAANEAAAALKNGDCSLTDGSSPGDWRLPTKDEWIAMISRAVALGCRAERPREYPPPLGVPPSLTNNAGTECYGAGAGSSFVGVASDIYWSSSSFEINPNVAWLVRTDVGEVASGDLKDAIYRVWPVRNGSR